MKIHTQFFTQKMSQSTVFANCNFKKKFGTGGQDFDVIDLMAGTTPTPIYTFSSTDREFCFSVTITDDMRFEAHEGFTVLARENPPSYSDLELFIIQNDTVTIWIEDTDRKLFSVYAFEGCMISVVTCCEASCC